VKYTRIKTVLILVAATILVSSCTYSQVKNTKEKEKNMEETKDTKNPVYSRTDTSKVTISDEDWKKTLSPEVYQVARQKGTERPWTSKFESLKDVGTYYCAVCGNALFKSDTKFESGCGWPSFYEPISKSSIIYLPDNSHGMKRTEVECGRCKSHLGHVFEDGPPPTGLRYCINGVVLDFEKAKEAEKKYNEKT
jgi:peptide-methionine (R)-S-oxide reductase